MSETTLTFYCLECHHVGPANDFMPAKHSVSLECVNRAACERRQKRDKILAEVQVKAAREAVHPVDRFTRLSVALCGIFMGAVIAIGLSYLWLGI